MIAKILHFYNGLTFNDLMNLDVVTTGKLYKAITEIEAQEMLKEFEIACLPHMKSQEDRNRVFSKYKRLAYPKKKKNLSTKEMADQLKSMFG